MDKFTYHFEFSDNGEPKGMAGIRVPLTLDTMIVELLKDILSIMDVQVMPLDVTDKLENMVECVKRGFSTASAKFLIGNTTFNLKIERSENNQKVG